MTNFALHTVLLLLIAFFLGCIVGCVLRAVRRRDEATAVGASARAEAAPAPEAEAAPGARYDAPAEPVAPDEEGSGRDDAADEADVGAEADALAGAVHEAAPDDLKLIKGIGNAIEQKLHAMGVTRFDQIADWTRDDIERVDGQLNFKGRIDREAWIAQAQKLAGGD